MSMLSKQSIDVDAAYDDTCELVYCNMRGIQTESNRLYGKTCDVFDSNEPLLFGSRNQLSIAAHNCGGVMVVEWTRLR
jgi:hypothetical protein